MKPNNNNKRKGLVRKSLGLFGIIGLAALAFYAGACTERGRAVEKGQQDAKVLDRLVGAARCNMVLQQLGSGRIADAKQMLSFVMAAEVEQANTLAASENLPTLAQAKSMAEQIDRDQKSHPDYYTTSLPKTHRAGTVQVAKGMEKQ